MSVMPINPDAQEPELYVLNSQVSRAEQVRRMQANVRALAREQVEVMTEALLEVARMADDIADGGEAYPIGVRELSRRLAKELGAHAKTIDVLLQRT